MNNNEKLRALLALPPIQSSASTALVVPQMPPQQVVTGDREVDAVLWLQAVIATGDSGLIDKALESAKALTTPMKELALRYGNHLALTHGAFGAALGSLGFGDLEDQARRAKEKAARRHEALSHFGNEENLFSNTVAERTCKAALRGLKQQGYPYYDPTAAAERFSAREALQPHTLDDCLYAMEYWDKLYWLRAAWENSGDQWPQVQAHDDYCFAMLANIKPRNQEEAVRALEYLDDDRMDRNEAPAILRNLVVSGWSQQESSGEEARTLRLIIDVLFSLEEHSSSSMLPDLVLHTIAQAKEKLAEIQPIQGHDVVTTICEAYEQGYQHGTKSYGRSHISLEDNPHETGSASQRKAWELGFLQGGDDRLQHGLQRPSEVDQYLLQAIRELEHCQRHKYEHCQIYTDIVYRADKRAEAQKLIELAEKAERHAKANLDDDAARLTAASSRRTANEAVKKLEYQFDDEPLDKPNEERT